MDQHVSQRHQNAINSLTSAGDHILEQWLPSNPTLALELVKYWHNFFQCLII